MYHEQVNSATQTCPFIIEHLNVKYIPHFHQEPEIVYVLDGMLTVSMGAFNYEIKKGDICIIPPDAIHNLYTHTYSKTFVIKLYPFFDLSNIGFTHHILNQDHPLYDKLLRYIAEILHESNTSHIGYELAVRILADRILLMLVRDFEHHQVDSKIRKKTVHNNDFLSRIDLFLEKKYTEDFLLEDVAALFNYNTSYFCRYFKKITGTTFWDYYTLFRLEKTIQYMRTLPNEPLSNIAILCGFKNVRSFNAAFKKFHRCTPSRYRYLYCTTDA